MPAATACNPRLVIRAPPPPVPVRPTSIQPCLSLLFNLTTRNVSTLTCPPNILLQAHKSHTLTFGITALDCGFDNPIFAAIELDYGDADADPTGEAAAAAQKHLTYYELDLGLNHVARKWSEPVRVVAVTDV